MQSRPTFKTEAASFSLAFVAICALAACTFLSWQWLKPATYEAAIVAELSQKRQEAAQNATEEGIPELLLNQKNERKGPTVTVDPESVGKENPFQ